MIDSMAEHSDFLAYTVSGLLTLLGVGFSIIGWFAVRTLKQIDKNQGKLSESIAELWKAFDNLCKDFYALKGSHEAYTGPERRKC